MLYLDHIVSLRPSCCYSYHVVFRPHHVVFRPHRSPSSILLLLFSCCIFVSLRPLMLLFSCCIQPTSFPFVHPDVTLLMLYLDHIVPLRPSWCYSSHVIFRPHRSPYPAVTLLMLYLDHIVPLRPSWCYSSPDVVFRPLLVFPFVHPDVTLLMLYSYHIVPLRPSCCYSSPVVFRPLRSPSSILMLLFSCCI